MATTCKFCGGPHPYWECRKAPDGWKPQPMSTGGTEGRARGVAVSPANGRGGASSETAVQIPPLPIKPVLKPGPVDATPIEQFRNSLAVAKKALAEIAPRDKRSTQRDVMRDRRAIETEVNEVMISAGVEIMSFMDRATAEDLVEAIYRAMWRYRGKKAQRLKEGKTE